MTTQAWLIDKNTAMRTKFRMIALASLAIVRVGSNSIKSALEGLFEPNLNQERWKYSIDGVERMSRSGSVVSRIFHVASGWRVCVFF